MDTLKEHWPLIVIMGLIVWAIYPAFLPVDQNILEHPGSALQQKTALKAANDAIVNTIASRNGTIKGG